jgi:hypothetical protein
LSITLAAMVVGLSGATARGIQDQIPEIPTARAMAAKSVTVTGCVGRGSAPDTYILTTTVREGEATGKDTSKPETLLLSAAHIDISKHVGQRVSVTGMHAAASQAIWIAAATEVKPAIESTMTKTAAKVPAEFTVQSLMMISASCSQAGD